MSRSGDVRAPTALGCHGQPRPPLFQRLAGLALFLPACVLATVGLIQRSWPGAFAVPMLAWLFLTSAGIVLAFVIAAQGGALSAAGPATMVSSIGIVTGALAVAAIARRPRTSSGTGAGREPR